MNQSRRTFLQQATCIGASALGWPAAAAASSGGGQLGADDQTMGVLVDLTKCSGCRSCEAACRVANGFAGDAPSPPPAAGAAPAAPRRPGPEQYTVVNAVTPTEAPAGSDPVFVKTNCMHCLEPACVSACLVKALERKPNGAVVYDPWKCMGCRYCMVACPFQLPAYEYNDAWTPQMHKCTFCMQAGNPHAGGVPACVQACPVECLTYGRREELLARARQKLKDQPSRYVDHIYGEHEAGGTAWLYIAGAPFEELGFVSVGTRSPAHLPETIQHGVFKHFMPPVAWCGILGMAMYLTRPERGDGQDRPAPAPHGDAGRENGEGWS